MNQPGLVTILLAYSETPQLFHARNPFASGGIYKIPATGAATAACTDYLLDIVWSHSGLIDIVQGEEMGLSSRLRAEISPAIGSSIRVSGRQELCKFDITSESDLGNMLCPGCIFAIGLFVSGKKIFQISERLLR